ncbi:MAG: hypothetical protein ACP5IZ_11920 [Thermoprotei archaeon]|jgi:predicted RNA-binding Zn-ribbon protein involved in translation (DUF1610 family)
MVTYREVVIKEIQKMLGYDFKETDLSPETRRKIGEMERAYNKLVDSYNLIISKQNNLTKLRKNTVLAGIILTIFFFLIVPIVILALVIVYYRRRSDSLKKEINNLKTNYVDLYNKYNEDLKTVSEEIHKELSELYRLKLRPEKVEYKISTSFSLTSGSLTFRCGYCGALLNFDKKNLQGDKYKCEYCGNFTIIPKRILELI